MKKRSVVFSFHAIVFMLFFCLSVSAAEVKIKGALPENLPPREKCADCHDINHIMKELTQSKHKDLKCFECHVPGRVQALKYSDKELSFSRLGYYEQEGVWVESSGNGACLRCHPNKEGVTGKCWSCHMAEAGTDNVIIVKDKQKPRSPENLKEIKVYSHKSHMFKSH